jgi:4-aminobutyrate aminotransferase-like enzyme
MGNHIFQGLQKLKEKYPVIGDVRGKGLLLGIELVQDRGTKEPAKAECAQVLETCCSPRSTPINLAERQRFEL